MIAVKHQEARLAKLKATPQNKVAQSEIALRQELETKNEVARKRKAKIAEERTNCKAKDSWASCEQ